MWVNVNGQRTEVSEQATIFEAISQAHETLLEPPLGSVREQLHNRHCPGLGMAEVDGELLTLAMLLRRPARPKQSIQTRTPLVESRLAEWAELLSQHRECLFVREWQKTTAVEAENGGTVTLGQMGRTNQPVREAAPSIRHDPAKCMRCRVCVEVCRDIQSVEALSFDEERGILLDDTRCVRCGQCIHHCPMGARAKYQPAFDFLGCDGCAFARPLGAMSEVDDTQAVWDILHDDTLYPVVQFAPAVRASLGEEFGVEVGSLVTNKLYAALRRLGFKRVWDTNFAADLTIMEEGSEFLERLSKGGRLPQFTSCSPGWIRFAETFFPDLLPHISTAKSPQQMFGAVAKSIGAKTAGVSPSSMRVISIMPCTAKKAEAARAEMRGAAKYWQENSLERVQGAADFADVDLVLTTRELGSLLKMAGIDLRSLPEEAADPLLGAYTGAAPIFGRTGGVMEAALRTAITLLAGVPPASLRFDALGTSDGIKTAQLQVKGKTLKVAVVHGLANARQVCESVRSGGEFAQYHFIEFMTCPGGCIGGGGQPIPTNNLTRQSRTEGLNRDDREICSLRMSHENPEVKQLYESYLGKPLSHLAHQLLHTHYTARTPGTP